jgi:hypothetical protein
LQYIILQWDDCQIIFSPFSGLSYPFSEISQIPLVNQEIEKRKVGMDTFSRKPTSNRAFILLSHFPLPRWERKPELVQVEGEGAWSEKRRVGADFFSRKPTGKRGFIISLE